MDFLEEQTKNVPDIDTQYYNLEEVDVSIPEYTKWFDDFWKGLE